MPYCRVCREFKPSVDYTVLCSRYPDGDWIEQCCFDCSDENEEDLKIAWKILMERRQEHRELLSSINATIPDDLKHLSYDEWKKQNGL